MQTINLTTDSFDQDNTFTVEVRGFKRMKTIVASLHRGYQTDADGIFWAMKRSACLKAEYTTKDMEESARLNAMAPVRHGDLVSIEGHTYRVRVLGDSMDCAIFDLTI